MRTFGCLRYPTITKQRDKFQARTTPHIFIGYLFGSKGCKVLSLVTKKIHISRDVIFKENICPFVVTSDVPFSPSDLHSVPFVDTVHVEIEPKTIQHVDYNVNNASHTPYYTLPDQPTDSQTTTLPMTSPNISFYFHKNESFAAPDRPSRSHKLPTYLHDYILPKLITKPTNQSDHMNIFLNAAFSKLLHITPKLVQPESQVRVRNIKNEDNLFHIGICYESFLTTSYDTRV